ncbi:hypothetical protein [Nostoc sp.]|uniref:hypothetical protein n=1 Tax=Nostoc sp. TaxID=1180 RepID=UPI002FF6DE03
MNNAAQLHIKIPSVSLLGGTVGVSSQNYRGDQLVSVPNSNRDRIGTSGIDARSQDIYLTSYLNKLKQRVQQQWLPGMSQSNRRTLHLCQCCVIHMSSHRGLENKSNDKC